MSDLKARLDRELAAVVPTTDARAAIDRRVVRRRRRRTVLLPTATLILTVGLVAGLTYAFSPDPAGTPDDKPGISFPVNQIAFTSYRDGRLMDIYLMNTDGTDAIRLTDSGAEDLLPAWSPDGSRIAFSSTRSEGSPHTDGHIFIMNADGTDQTRIVFDLSSAGSPAWSPDGTKIAFAGCCRPGWDIYVIDEDGTGLVQLTSDELFDSSPDWSPDGSRIVFGRDDDGTGPKLPTHGLYLMSPDGTGLRQLTHGYGAQPAWSPAHNGIAFTRFGDRRGIYVIDPRSGEEVRLTSRQDTEPAWSPDGTRIAFTSYRVNGEGDIFVMESDGSHQTQITDNPFGDYEAAWQPPPGGSTASKEEETSAGAPFVPHTRLEGDAVVMPITLPDGRSMEIVYPQHLDLASLAVRAVSFAEPTQAPECAAILYAYHGTDRFFHDEGTPEATYPSATGEPVELWDPPANIYPQAWLVFSFDSWRVGVPVQFSCTDEDILAMWARSVTGRETTSGFLVLDTKPPVRTYEPGDPDAPGLIFEDDRFQVHVFSAACTPFDDASTQRIGGKDVRRTEGLAQWCLSEDSILVRIEGDDELIDALIRDIGIRRVSRA